MATTPKFNIGEVVYRIESAVLGELEAYRIDSIHQKSLDDWLYQIFIEQKAPAEQSVGDRIDLKTTQNLFFDEDELFTLCEAVEAAINNVQARINKAESLLSGTTTGATGSITSSEQCSTIPLPPNKMTPRFDVGERIFVKSSAGVGFLESYKIVNVHRVPAAIEFTYELDLSGTSDSLSLDLSKRSHRRSIFFLEHELIDQCEALNLVLNALDRKMGRLLNIKLSLCTVEL